MCGIVGYHGTQKSTPVITQALKRIEYRGYDSAGLTTYDKHRHTFCTTKVKGGVAELEERLIKAPKSTSKIGIGHTRWATHGVPSEENAHPHESTDFALVHNGIIENYEHIKKVLIKQGYNNFKSETDTEVLVWLIQRNYDKTQDIRRAIATSLKIVRGTFGIALLAKAEPDSLFLARRGSPIVIGESGKSIHVSSDIATMTKGVKKVRFLEDDQIATITSGKIDIHNLDHELQDVMAEDFKMSREEATKAGHDHFLIKEIYEQPESAAETIRGRTDVKTRLGGLAGREADIRKLESLIGIGCGTAYYAGMLSSYLLEDITDLPMRVEMASEFLYRKNYVKPDKTMGLIISQSGETADTISATNKLNMMGVHTHGVVNVIGSTISRMTDSGTYLHAGPEISVASTKAFTSQVAAQLIIGMHLNEVRGNPIKNNPKVSQALGNLPVELEATIKDVDSKVQKLAEQYSGFEHAMFLGRNSLFPVALEGALKLKEISYMQTEAHPAGEMKHGPLALIDENMLVIFLIQKGPLFEKSVSNLREIESRGGNIIVITDDENYAQEHEAIFVQTSSPHTAPLLFNVPLQLLAYHIANSRHLSIDKPRNLAKSVTVE